MPTSGRSSTGSHETTCCGFSSTESGTNGYCADYQVAERRRMEGAEWKDDLQGTPQGAVVSLANVYLHYVLDLWFQKKWRARKATGDTIIVRYCDDFVVGCQRKADAEQFLHDLAARCIPTRHASSSSAGSRWRTAGRGGSVARRPSPWIHALLPEDEERRFRPGTQADCEAGTRTLRLKERLRTRMHEDVHATAQWLGKVVNGWLNYYAVPTSSRTLGGFVRRLEWIWLAPCVGGPRGHGRR